MNNDYLKIVNYLNDVVKTKDNFKLSDVLNNQDFNSYDVFILVEAFKGNFVESKDISVIPEFYFVPLNSLFKIKNLSKGYTKIFDYLVKKSDV